MIKAVQVEVSEKLTGEVADGQPPPSLQGGHYHITEGMVHHPIAVGAAEIRRGLGSVMVKLR